MKKIWKLLLLILLVILIVLSFVFAFVLRPYFEVAKKPAIYLYPEQTSEVFVQVNVNGFLTKTIPDYGAGWTVTATPEGIINNKYDYLFYEAALKKVDIPKEGWIIPQEELESWFDATLPKLGLTEKEIAQFKEYWLAELPSSDYYEIHLLSNEFLNENMALNISPQPQTVIRTNFYFRPVNSPGSIKEPKIETPKREGFTVVEWGGIIGKP